MPTPAVKVILDLPPMRPLKGFEKMPGEDEMFRARIMARRVRLQRLEQSTQAAFTRSMFNDVSLAVHEDLSLMAYTYVNSCMVLHSLFMFTLELRRDRGG